MKSSKGFKACNWIKIVCSKHKLKFVKNMHVFFPYSTRGCWEDHSTKSHNQWPKKCSMATRGNYLEPKATNRQLIATTQRQISTNRPEISDE